MKRFKRVALLIMMVLLAPVMPAAAYVNPLCSISGTSSDNIYVSGSAGLILHYNGISWQEMESHTTAQFYGVYAVSDNSVYAGSQNQTNHHSLFHFNGAEWTPVAAGTGDSIPVWGASADFVIAGDHYYDGAGWHDFNMPEEVLDLHGVSDTFVVGVGSNDNVGAIGLYNGSAPELSLTKISEAFPGMEDVPPLTGVWCLSGNEIYAVGAGGTVLHFTSSGGAYSCEKMTSHTDMDLLAVYASAPDDVFAVGTNGMIHYDGTAWSLVTQSELLLGLIDIWGSSADDIYAISQGGMIIHFDGVQWEPVHPGIVPPSDWKVEYPENSPGSIDTIWGLSANQIFAVGNAVTEYNGTQWNTIGDFSTFWASSVWGTSSSNLFAMTSGGLYHYDGQDWTTVLNMQTISGLASLPDWQSFDLWGVGTDEAYSLFGTFSVGNTVYIIHYDGTGQPEVMKTITTASQWNYASLWGFASNNVYASLEDCIYHYDGNDWTAVYCDSGAGFKDIWGSAPNNIYVAGNSSLYHYDGTGWGVVSGGYTGRKIYGAGSQFYCLDGQTLHYFNGTGWIDISIPEDQLQFADGMATNNIYDLWCDELGNAYVPFAAGAVLRFDGDDWSLFYGPANLDKINDVWGASGNDIFAVGNDKILHNDGAGWSIMTAGIPLGGDKVWGSAGDDVYALSEYQLLHYDGNDWQDITAVACDDCAEFNNIWGSAADDIYIVGSGGLILHYDGSSWTEMTSNTGEALLDVWGNGPNDIYVVGGHYNGNIYSGEGIVLHYDGSSWTDITTSVPNVDNSCTAVWGFGPNDVLVAAGSDIYHYNGTSWRLKAETWTIIRDIWGSSMNDLYVTSGIGIFVSTFSHFNGKSWSTYLAPVSQGDIWGPGPDAAYLCSYNQIWKSIGVDKFPTQAPAQISPGGLISDDTPAYVWQAVPKATMYGLWVNDATGIRLVNYYNAADVCSGGTCSVTPPVAVTNYGKWWVAPFSKDGFGPWSAGLEFELPGCLVDDSGAVDIMAQPACYSEANYLMVPVRILRANKPQPANPVEALGFEVTYDPQFLQFIDFVTDDVPDPLPSTLLGAGEWYHDVQFVDIAGGEAPINYNNELSSGLIRIGAYSLDNPVLEDQEGILGYLKFRTLQLGCSNLCMQNPVDDIADWPISGARLMPATGDLNLDGEITPRDALCAFQVKMERCDTSCGPCVSTPCDVDRDCACTGYDALCIFKAYLKLPNCLDAAPTCG